MVLSDDKFLRSHSFGGVDLDEIIESDFYMKYLIERIIVDFGVGKGPEELAAAPVG